MKFQYKPVRYNYSSRKGNKIQFLVIHDTGNPSKGANAYMHYRYFNGGNRNASAHYFADDTGIIQIIGDSYSAWHCGDRWNRKYATRNDVKNSNSIGIEICINKDGDYQKTYRNVVELVKNLMVKFHIPLNHVVRHFDASGKSCPNHMRPNNWAKWKQFKEDISKPILTKIDLSKNSTFDFEKPLQEREKLVKEDPTKKYEKDKVVDKDMAEIGKKFEQDKPSEWAKEDWQWGQDVGLTDGTNPKNPCTREQVMAMLHRYDTIRHENKN